MNRSVEIKQALEQMEHDLERLKARRKERAPGAPVDLPAATETSGRPAWLIFALICLGVWAAASVRMHQPALLAAALIGTLAVIGAGWPAGRPGSSERLAAKLASVERRVEALARGGASTPGIDEDIEGLRTVVRSLLAAVEAEPPAEAGR